MYPCLRAKIGHPFWNSHHEPIKSTVFVLFSKYCGEQRQQPAKAIYCKLSMQPRPWCKDCGQSEGKLVKLAIAPAN